MNRISKSIKKFRTVSGMTQSELAEKMFVTRQTVSSWENGRTQPDIDSLTALSQALSVSVEELIYGEKPKLIDDGHNEKARKMMITIFSVLASLLVGVGGALVFINYWSVFPQLLKTVFTALPLIVGQAAGVFVFLKKYDRIPWREGASVLWCAGVAATVALCDSLLMLPTDAFSCMVIDMIMFLPVVFVLDAAAPLIAIYVMSGVLGVYYAEQFGAVSSFAVMFLPAALGAVYCFLRRKNTENMRDSYSVWITVIAFLAFSVIFTLCVSTHLYAAPIIAVFMLAYAFKDRGVLSSPCRIIPTVLLPVMSFIVSIMMRPSEYVDYYLDMKYDLTLSYLFVFLVSAVCAVAAFIILLRRNKSGKSGLFFALSSFLMFSVSLTGLYEKFSGKLITYVIIYVVAMAQGVSLVSLGAKENRFLPLNMGLLTIIALIMELVLSQDIDVLLSGFIMIFFGVILFVINYRLAKKDKPLKEVTENEE